MNLFAPLLAVDLFDVIRVVVIFLIFVVPVISHVLAKIKQIPPPNQRPIPPRPELTDIADEIEEFMRRAAGQQRNPNAPRAAQAKQLQQERQQPVTAEPVQAEVVADRHVGGQVGEHVNTYLDEQKFTQRGEELGKEVSQGVDKEIGQHLQQVFSHPVSKLAAVSGEAAAPPVAYEPPDLVGAAADIPDTFATGLLELVSNPDSLRQAIILSEVLHRPEERWA